MGRNTHTCKKRQSKRTCRGQKSLQPNKADLDTLWKWFLPNDGIFAKIQLHGNINWTPVYLVFMILCWAWSDSRNLTDAFAEAAAKVMVEVDPADDVHASPPYRRHLAGVLTLRALETALVRTGGRVG